MALMQKHISRLNDQLISLLKHYLEIFLVLLIVPLVSIVFSQVLFRYLFRAPPFWTEEAARYLFIWASYIGAAYAFKKKEHITLTVVEQYLPVRFRPIYKQLINIVVLFMLGIFIYYGLKSCMNVYGVLSPALGINMVFVNAALPTSASIMLAYQLKFMIEDIRCS